MINITTLKEVREIFSNNKIIYQNNFSTFLIKEVKYDQFPHPIISGIKLNNWDGQFNIYLGVRRGGFNVFGDHNTLSDCDGKNVEIITKDQMFEMVEKKVDEFIKSLDNVFDCGEIKFYDKKNTYIINEKYLFDLGLDDMDSPYNYFMLHKYEVKDNSGYSEDRQHTIKIPKTSKTVDKEFIENFLKDKFCLCFNESFKKM